MGCIHKSYNNQGGVVLDDAAAEEEEEDAIVVVATAQSGRSLRSVWFFSSLAGSL